MAQYDTGLGWSANQGWLLYNAPLKLGEVGDFGGPSFPGQPIPKNITGERELYSSGFTFATRDASGGTIETLKVVATGNYDVVVGRYALSGGAYSVAFISMDPDANILWRIFREDGTWYGGPGGALRTSRIVDGNTFYFTTWTVPASSAATTYPTVDPLYESIDSLIRAIQIEGQPFYKIASGWTVAAMATWIDLGGVKVSSPVLISTDQDAVAISLDGVTPGSATVGGYRWQNTTFYMALMPGYTGSVIAEYATPADITAAFPNPTSISILFEAIARGANIMVSSTPDPYGGDAQPGGGEGNPDEDEEIDFSTPPSVGSYVGFFRMWNPTEAELRQLASWMWSSAFDLDTFKRIFSAPIDAILGLSLLPVQPAGIGGYTIVLGGIDTAISAFTVTNRYVTLDCGSLTVDERWGAYLDYSPFTKMSIFLPYIGFRDISTDDVMGKTVALQYNVDVLSGACVAELKCGGSVLYSWQGNCAQQLPITSADWSNALSAALGLAGTAAAAIVTGGGSLPLAGTVASATVNALSLKPRMERGGSISGAAGAMAGQVPYLVRERPEQAVPGRQNHFIGYPSFTTVTLGSIAGYTEVESIHLEGIPATAAELSELESILKEGFIL